MKLTFYQSFLIIQFCFTSLVGFTQIIDTLQPNAADGIDAQIDSRVPDHNNGVHTDFMAHAWTNQGTPTNGRALLNFDLAHIPDSAVILSAHLSLFGIDSPNGNGTHSALSGDNSCEIRMVTSPWSEQSVTWNNQPTTSGLYAQTLNGPVDQVQDFLDIDVTQIIQLMHSDPNSYHGFMMQLVEEDFYRRMVFASSDHLDPEKRPKLVIVYEVNEPGGGGSTGGGINSGGNPTWPDGGDDTPINEDEEAAPEEPEVFEAEVIMPNVFTPNGDGSNDFFEAVEATHVASAQLTILNRWGSVVHNTSSLTQSWDGQINGVSANEGTYFYQLIYEDQKGTVFKEQGVFQLIK